MTPEILSAIQTLTKPPGETSSLSVQSSQHETLLAALKSNRALLHQRLLNDNSLKEVRRLREEVQEEEKGWFKYNPTEEEEQEGQAKLWTFVQECLLLLLTLRRHLSNELQRFQQTPPRLPPTSTPDFAPPLPPDVLSVSQQRTLGAALQLLLGLGLCPYLAPGVGVPLNRRSSLGDVVEKLVTEGTGPEGTQHLLMTTKVLLELSELTSLSTLILTQHLGDLMAALCQLGHQPLPQGHTQLLSAEERVWCKEALNNLLGKVYQPMVIKELLILQGGPKQSRPGRSSTGSSPSPAPGSCPAWLRRLCGQLLSQRLIQPNGVQAVVRAILEGGTGGESDWRKCDAVARILVACPQQSASADHYFKLVCPQILDLLHFKDKLTAQQFQRVATRAALSMVQERLNFARQYLLKPMLNPLHHCTTNPEEGDVLVVVDEEQLTRCVDDIYKVWVVGNSPSAPLLEALEEVLPVIFTLFCFTKKNVSHLRAPCQEVLLWYLSHSDLSAAQLTLRCLSGLQKGVKDVCEDLQFTPGSDGGVQLSRRESCRDEDQELYEKLSGGQWRLECLMELLSGMKDSDLPGDFFLHLLQDLTCWASSEDKAGEEESVDVSGMSLLEAERRLVGVAEKRGRSLDLLQVVAVMVETLPHEQLLRKTSQVVDFLVSLLLRACVGLDRGHGPAVDNPVESQTLSMGMGLAATLLSGPQLSAEDFSSMSRLLPPLDTLSRLHPEVFIQELASNLRAVIGTQGALHNTAPMNSNDPKPTASTPLGRKRTSDTHLSSKPLSDWLLEACDPDIPTRAFALRNLTNMIQTKDPETVRDQEKVLNLFLENLEHEDSFIYLSAIQGLAALADSHPERILERLLKDFQQGPSLPSSNRERSLETRLKVGEVLMRASRAMGDLAPHLGRPLVGVFLRGTRDPDATVRVSSLSNLGELCQRLEYSLGPLAQELSSCLTALIKTEKEAEVRRAAVHVIVLLIRGLGDKITQVLGDVLLDLYRTLKRVCVSDRDEVVLLHAGLALEELEEVMRRLVFPQQKLEKKIVVLP